MSPGHLHRRNLSDALELSEWERGDPRANRSPSNKYIKVLLIGTTITTLRTLNRSEFLLHFLLNSHWQRLIDRPHNMFEGFIFPRLLQLLLWY